MAIDPVCGKEVDEAAARAVTGQSAYGAADVDPTAGTRRFWGGKWYYLCSVDCRFKFMANPDTYVKKAAS